MSRCGGIFTQGRRIKLCCLVLGLELCAVAGNATGFTPGAPRRERRPPLLVTRSSASQASHLSAPSRAPSPKAVPAPTTLKPERRAEAIAYSHQLDVLYFAEVALSLGIYGWLWRGRIAIRLRDWARHASPRHAVQCLIFVPSIVLVAGAIRLPLTYYSGFALEHQFGLSTQTFSSWLGDWSKSLVLGMVFRTFLVWMLYLVVRRSPLRWWFYFWLATLPVALGVILAEPLVVDPLFHKFTPLEKTQPLLTARIEAMLHHARLEIPGSRIFEMDASAKTTALNAYVTGIGASKRVVVWDTTIRASTPDEILLTLGHEAGHYALDHIPKGFALSEAGSLAGFFVGSLVLAWIVERWGAKTGVEGLGDLASYPIFLLVLTALSFLASPIYCGVSRALEHQADQFALEAAYGVAPDPNAAAVRSLERMGEADLEDPDPSPLIKFWLYTHPPLDERIRFAASYKPWVEGKPLEFVPPPHAP